MAANRANTLLEILPSALETGFSQVFPDPEPLKVGTAWRIPYTKLMTVEL